MKRLAPLFVLLALAACSSGADASDVDWSKYPDGTWTRIDGAGCGELQDLFDAFDDMDTAIRARHGEGSGDVLNYIDARLEEEGCY